MAVFRRAFAGGENHNPVQHKRSGYREQVVVRDGNRVKPALFGRGGKRLQRGAPVGRPVGMHMKVDVIFHPL
jgi:hypothetical protein